MSPIVDDPIVDDPVVIVIAADTSQDSATGNEALVQALAHAEALWRENEGTREVIVVGSRKPPCAAPSAAERCILRLTPGGFEVPVEALEVRDRRNNAKHPRLRRGQPSEETTRQRDLVRDERKLDISMMQEIISEVFEK